MPTTARPATPRGIPISSVVDHFGLEVVTESGQDLSTRLLTTARVNRPGLQWAGYSEQFPTSPIQLIGRAEMDYLRSLPTETRFARLEQYAQLGMPAVVVARGLQFDARAVEIAESYAIPVLRTGMATGDFASELHWYLSVELAPRVVVHAGLVDVAGEGVLILGDPGIGKSETALELIRRGHRLIADDTVEIRRPTEHDLIGRAPGRMRSFMEVKGIGIVNLRLMYGVGSVKATADVSLVVSLQHMAADRDFSAEPDRMDILGVQVPLVTIPVRPGRNNAVLIETAAMDIRARRMLRPDAGIRDRSSGRDTALEGLP
jgi:HPr kinase/phosphorylase